MKLSVRRSETQKQLDQILSTGEGVILSTLLRKVVDLLHQIRKANMIFPINLGFNTFDVMKKIRRSHVRVTAN